MVSIHFYMVSILARYLLKYNFSHRALLWFVLYCHEFLAAS